MFTSSCLYYGGAGSLGETSGPHRHNEVVYNIGQGLADPHHPRARPAGSGASFGGERRLPEGAPSRGRGAGPHPTKPAASGRLARTPMGSASLSSCSTPCACMISALRPSRRCSRAMRRSRFATKIWDGAASADEAGVDDMVRCKRERDIGRDWRGGFVFTRQKSVLISSRCVLSGDNVTRVARDRPLS